MPAVYDVENLVADITALLKAKLNAAITAIEAEKTGQGLPVSGIKQINDAAYFPWGLDEKAVNHSPAVGIWLVRATGTGEGPFTKTEFLIDVGVMLSTANDAMADHKAMRYARAVRDVFEKNWGKINNCVTREKIETIAPIAFKFYPDDAETFKIAGVSIIGTLG